VTSIKNPVHVVLYHYDFTSAHGWEGFWLFSYRALAYIYVRFCSRFHEINL